MKKIIKNKIFIVMAALVLIGGSGFAFVKNQKKEATQEKTKEQSSQDVKPTTEDVPATNTPATEQKSNPTTPTANTAVSVLSNVTLTVYLNMDAVTSGSGSVVSPADSLSPYFYPPAGVFTVQKLSGSSWVDVASNINYEGHGGIAAAATSATEDNISYRVLKIEGGRTASVSKIFTVKRADLKDGMATYN